MKREHQRMTLYLVALLAPPLAVAWCGYPWQVAVVLLLWVGWPPFGWVVFGWPMAAFLACTAVYRHLTETAPNR